MSTGVPELDLDDLVLHLEGLGRELDVDGGRRRVELVLHPAAEQVRLSNSGISDDNNLIPIKDIKKRGGDGGANKHRKRST